MSDCGGDAIFGLLACLGICCNLCINGRKSYPPRAKWLAHKVLTEPGARALCFCCCKEKQDQDLEMAYPEIVQDQPHGKDPMIANNASQRSQQISGEGQDNMRQHAA
ncbi:hypothetical protein BDR04DRAFT_1116043 [Suillus decipiens]|nr:hypothetical protein BDR04DRAFT_1116043 [Suillus decipiens]